MSEGKFLEKSQTNVSPKVKIYQELSLSPTQRYKGETLHNGLHGNGFYYVENEENVFSDCLFYASKYEGYGQVFYDDGSTFQGLFKNNKRFGPGIFTKANGEQDVGLWVGFSLVKLATTVESNIIPTLANSPVGKLRLLKYRYLVPICSNNDDLATEILQSVDANDKVLNYSHKLYNSDVQNKNSIFFNKKLHDEQFFKGNDCTLDIIIEENDTIIDENDEKLEDSLKQSNIDLARINQINEELQIIENKLNKITKLKNHIFKKVEHCRSCCYNENRQYDNNEVIDKDVDMEKCSLEGKSSDSIDYENDIHHFLQDDQQGESDAKVEDYLLSNCFCFGEMVVEDLDRLERELEIAKKHELFYETVKEKLREKMEYHTKSLQTDDFKVKTKQIIVNHLLSWNNEQLSMNMLKHSFVHRKSEYMITFDVVKLLAGDRSKFSDPGQHEKNCINFLKMCCKGDVKEVLKYLNKHYIISNLCDARGNTGIFFAVAMGKFSIIPVLVNFGAKLDQVNDEGLTPLSLGLLLYVALKYDITDWENSFLPDTESTSNEETDIRRWQPIKSILSLNETIRESFTSSIGLNVLLRNRITDSSSNRKNTYIYPKKENYFFDTSCRQPSEEVVKIQLTTKKKSSVDLVSQSESNDDTKILINDTILTLLECGADPNVGEVPLCPLFIAIFTENANLVCHILESKAEVNVVTADENLNGLHIIATLRCVQENVNICEVLLNFNCDPNAKTSVSHWPEQKAKILGNIENSDEIEDSGKNPLHMLCLRRDFQVDECSFFEKIANLLIDHRINVNDMYLGHTPLSIAVLMGNCNLIETLVKIIDPYMILGHNMGNILTIYMLKKYENIMEVDKCKEILRLLVGLGVNPLNSVGQFENSIVFLEKLLETVKVDKASVKSKMKVAKKEAKLKSTKSSKKDKKTFQNILKEYLKELARNTIIKYIQLEAVRDLYNLTEENMLEHDCVRILPEYLTPQTALENLLILFNYGKIDNDRFDKNICLQLLEFVDKFKIVTKTKKSKKQKAKAKSLKKSEKSSQSALNYSDIIDSMDFNEQNLDEPKIKLPKFGLDSTSKYKVCFQCLQKRNKSLVSCPRCRLIYFCSEQCNKLNVKSKGLHNCNLSFYGDLNLFENEFTGVNLEEVCKKARKSCLVRLNEKRDREFRMHQERLKEEMKADIYGTKFLHVKCKERDRNRKLLKSRSTIPTEPSFIQSSFFHKPPDSAIQMNTTIDDRLTRLSIITEKRTQTLSKINTIVSKQMVSLTKRKSKKRLCKCDEQTKISSMDDQNLDFCYRQKIQSILRNLQKTSEGDNLENDLILKLKSAVPQPQNTQKIRTIPKKYQYFIELLAKYFPEIDFSSLFLPYACYTDGQLYYKFLNEDIFSNTYSLM